MTNRPLPADDLATSACCRLGPAGTAFACTTTVSPLPPPCLLPTTPSLSPPCLLSASSLSLYCLVLPVVDGNGVYALWTWSGIDRAEVISFLQPLPKWSSFVNWSSLTLFFSSSYFDFQNTLTVIADHFLAYKAAESFLRILKWKEDMVITFGHKQAVLA